MPNPVPLATKEEEDRRTWVTSHHEVVKLIKDCFGDRFSNNEIFDRLKISRRTGYRALGNDERIGKAPGRKPKISEETIKNMVEYIETGGCTEVGNVWKHLAERFAPDCNPKTVQDAVKKSGFKNSRNTVKLEPLLNEEVSDNQPAPVDEPQLPNQPQAQSLPSNNQFHSYQLPSANIHSSVIDPAFQHSTLRDILKQSIDTTYDNHIRWIMWQICCNSAEAESMAIGYLCPQLTSQPLPQMQTHAMHHYQHNDHSALTARRPRLAVCRRCGIQFDRAENIMANRHCLYHKGSPVKTQPASEGTIEEDPEAYTWSCCGGNGLVRGCCRAMHTTKKKRKYGKKRSAGEAGLDDEKEDGDDSPTSGLEDDTTVLLSNAQQSHLTDTGVNDSGLDDRPMSHHMALRLDHRQLDQTPMVPSQHQDIPQDNIDARLRDIDQELQSQPLTSHQMMMFQQLQAYDMQDPVVDDQNGYVQLNVKNDPNDPMAAHPGMEQVARHLQQTQEGAHLSPDFQAQFAAVQGMRPHG